MTDRVLIYGGSFVATADRAWLVQRWARLTRALNPGTDILIFDAASPMFPDTPEVTVHRFPDNIGHLSERPGELPGDGWGRAMCAGIDHAISRGYDAIAFIETDVLFVHPVTAPIAEMRAAGKHFASPMVAQRSFRESDLFFADVAWLHETDFVGRYNWPAYRPIREGHPNPEIKVMELSEPSIHVLGYRGARANDASVSEDDCRGLDWLTHGCQWQYEAFLRGHGWGDLV